MKKAKFGKILLAALSLLLAMALCACGGGQSSGAQGAGQGGQNSPRQTPQSRATPSSRPANTQPVAPPTSESYPITNTAFPLLTELYVSDASNTVWGNNLVGGGGMEHEESIFFSSSEEYVDIYYVDDAGGEYEVYDVYIEPGCMLELTAGQAGYGVKVTYSDGEFEYYEVSSNTPFDPVDPQQLIFFEIANESIWAGDSLVYIYATPLSFISDSVPEDLISSGMLYGDEWTTAALPSTGYYSVEMEDQNGVRWYYEDVYIAPDYYLSFYRDGSATADWLLDVVDTDDYVIVYYPH